jgi:hypothetical protein
VKGLLLFFKKLGVDIYDLIPAERQNKTTALSVASVLTSTESVRTNSLVRESSLKPLKNILNKERNYKNENV